MFMLFVSDKPSTKCERFDMPARLLVLIYCRAGNQMVIVRRNWFIRFIWAPVPISRNDAEMELMILRSDITNSIS